MAGWTDDNGALDRAISGRSEKRGKTSQEVHKELRATIQRMEDENITTKKELKNLRDLNTAQIKKNEKLADKLNAKRREEISNAGILKTKDKEIEQLKKESEKQVGKLKVLKKECEKLKCENEAIRKESTRKIFCGDLLKTRSKVEEFFVAQEEKTKVEFEKMIESSQKLVELAIERPVSKDKQDIIESIEMALLLQVSVCPIAWNYIIQKERVIYIKKNKKKQGGAGLGHTHT